ncbi:integration host factor subunit alpha [Mannheimia granulomatis]|uniref:Integration host factor subunit alpha n=1 Tax=Mannheimia granulomatis TaxID=85402 RepID=A0A011NBA0_9PAST|nr:integration host factor subunit alpha [Mannheimia granulomatis]EXI61872.1 integration host factor subunit alpha [Mannheimia granulomatis]QLB14782.1 integration host factor subunit alpha [Mannheimia granulomatis]QLB18936.1 integration host factor subunit alpha [Mannheimia granulomatis]RGE49221.1 transcriptional regulator [Mannheimia granulomatis]
MALTKIEIAENLIAKYGLEKRIAKQFVESFFEEIRSSLERGDSVKLSGFGNFLLREKKSRPGRNPKTGENVAVSARRVVVFKAGQKLRERVENANTQTEPEA